MKTTLEKFLRDEGIYELVEKYYERPDISFNDYIAMPEANLAGLFRWLEAPEGFTYWNKLYLKYKSLTQEEDLKQEDELECGDGERDRFEAEYFDLMCKLKKLENEITKYFGAPFLFYLQLEWTENKQYEDMENKND